MEGREEILTQRFTPSHGAHPPSPRLWRTRRLGAAEPRPEWRNESRAGPRRGRALEWPMGECSTRPARGTRAGRCKRPVAGRGPALRRWVFNRRRFCRGKYCCIPLASSGRPVPGRARLLRRSPLKPISHEPRPERASARRSTRNETRVEEVPKIAVEPRGERFALSKGSGWRSCALTQVVSNSYTRISFTTWPSTSVRRKRRPW
jgi:hypothetical protein